MRHWLLVLLGVALLGPFLAFAIGWLIFRVPTADDAKITQVATFTYADGTTPLATVRPQNVNRVKVTLDKVDPWVQKAVLAAEDRSFYSNPGFDIGGIGRAIYKQLTGGVGGGSTITQQYIKVSTGQDDFSLWRKYKEVVLAVKISREQTKDEILENYLNTIYFGRGAYGIEAAAKAYFGKSAAELTLSEGALLAGIIQSPSNWDPGKSPENAERRWAFVLDGMVEQKWISPAERASQRFPTNWSQEAAPLGDGVPSDHLYHVYDKALEELAARGITQQQIDTSGLKVTTTVDRVRQEEAAQIVSTKLKGVDNLRSALVSVNPKTGAILAYYGGANGLGTDYAAALRQPGSSFKPFVLAAALESGRVGLGSTYNGTSPQTFEGTKVENSEGFNCARCTVQTAMTRSINTIFYKVGLDVGIPKVVDAAHRAGIPPDLLPEVRGGTSLGDQEVHPVDMASAFATFAADGMRREPFIVAKVETADGQVLYARDESSAEPAFSPEVARNVTQSMLDVPRSSGIGLRDGRPVAAKTGTVQLDKTGQNKDAWTVGFTPSVSTAVWVGSDRSDPIKDRNGRSIFGRGLPGSIWQQFMNTALNDTPKEQFSRFTPLGEPPVAESSTADADGSATSASPSPSGSPQSGSPSSPSGAGSGSGDDDGTGGGASGTGGGRGNPVTPFGGRATVPGAGDDGGPTPAEAGRSGEQPGATPADPE